MRTTISILLVLVLMSGCSNKPSIELISSSVQISDDRAGGIVTHKDNQEKTIKTLSLSYTFILKNTGDSVGSASKMNNFEYVNGIKANIVPNEKLIVVSNEVLGFNLYGQEKTRGQGKTGAPILGKNQQAEYTFDYLLGAKEDYPVFANPICSKVDGIACPKIDVYNDRDYTSRKGKRRFSLDVVLLSQYH